MSDFHRLIGRKGAYVRWSRETDRSEATAKARLAFNQRFDREVDPEGKLDPALRAKLAASARSAYYADLVLKRRKRRQRRSAA